MRLLDAATIFAVQASEIEEAYVRRAMAGLKSVQSSLLAEIQEAYVPVVSPARFPVAVASSFSAKMRQFADEIVESFGPLMREAAEAYPQFLNRAMLPSERQVLTEQFVAPGLGFDFNEVEPASDEFDLQEDLFQPLQEFFLALLLLNLQWQLVSLRDQWELMIQRQQAALRLQIASAIALELQDATDGIVSDTKLRTVVSRQLVNSLRGAGGRGGPYRTTVAVDALVRTQFQAVIDAVVRETHNRNSRVLAGEVWSAMLDSSTCARCANLHGEYFPLKEGKSTMPTIPLHVRCRCRGIPVLRKVRGVEQQGAVPRLETYPEWFARQPERVQRAILGPARFRLWAAGKLKFRDFVQFRNKVPVRVRDLKSLGRAAN